MERTQLYWPFSWGCKLMITKQKLLTTLHWTTVCFLYFMSTDAQQCVSIYLLCYVRLSIPWSSLHWTTVCFLYFMSTNAQQCVSIYLLCYVRLSIPWSSLHWTTVCFLYFMSTNAQQCVSIYLLCYVRLSIPWSCCLGSILFLLKKAFD